MLLIRSALQSRVHFLLGHRTRLAVAAVVALLALVGTASAQTSPTNPPQIVISPASRTVLDSTLVVRITLCGDRYGVDENHLQITLNGASVLGDFSITGSPVWPSGYEQCVTRTQYVGTISTTAPTSLLMVSVPNNYHSHTGEKEATYNRPAPVRAVTVVANAQYVDVTPNAASPRSFTITNTAAQADSFTVTASCTAHTSCTLTGGPTVHLGAGASTTATVNYGASGTVGTIGTAKVVARSKSATGIADSAWSELAVAAGSSSGVSLVSSPDYLDMSQCVRVGAPGMAVMCGKAVFDHPLPAMRTMNRTWEPRLVYNAATSAPMAAVRADVTPYSGLQLDSVTAELVMYGAGTARGKWKGSEWASGGTRRIGLAVSALNLPTGRHTFVLQVFHWRGTSKLILGSASGTLAVVNRKLSLFGPGWWVSGVEQLSTIGGMLWVGGDGSYASYATLNDSTWVSPNVTAQDTIKRVGTHYHRYLAEGGVVVFNSAGQHVYTENRNGWRTHFDYSGNYLTAIKPPLPSGDTTKVRYRITYSGSTVTVTASSDISGSSLSRSVVVTHCCTSTMVSILDPDGRKVNFRGTTSPSWLTGRQDKRGYWTGFSSRADRSVAVITGPALPTGGAYTLDYFDAQMRGMGVTGFPTSASVLRDSAFTQVNGPRSDVPDITTFWVNRFGAPVRIRNGAGQETKVTYDAAWTGIPKEVRDAAGSVTAANVRADGLLGSTTAHSFRDDGVAATTTLTWNTSVRRPTMVQQPLGDYVTMDYDAQGNLIWQRPATDATRQVSYGYTNGQVTSMSLPENGSASFTYDALGNLKTATSAAGWTTTYYGDAFGRDTLVVSPINASFNSQSKTWYDAMGRAWRTATYGPAMSGRAADSIVVWHTYDEEGNVRFTHRGFLAQGVWQQLQHSWTYDALGRVTTEVRDDGTTTNYTRDAAGNATEVWGDRGYKTLTTYDALNRPTRRITPSVSYPQMACMLPSGMSCFYTFPTRGTAVVLRADTAVFGYDAGGRLVQADNRYARVRRAYTRSGLLTHDSLRVRKLVGSMGLESSTGGTEAQADAGSFSFPPDWEGGCTDPSHCYAEQGIGPGIGVGEPEAMETSGSGMTTGTTTVSTTASATATMPSPGIGDDFTHTYVLRYHYDLNGRRDSLYYPGTAPCLGTCTKRQGYGYSSLTGALEQLVDLAEQSHSIAYDLRGRPWQTTSPGWQVTLGYNQDDEVTTHASDFGTVNIERDALGRMSSTWGAVSAYSTYDGLGHLVAVTGISPGTNWETYGYDALGNRNWFQRDAMSPTLGDNGIRWQVGDVTGRVYQVTSDPTQNLDYWLEQNYDYDAAGNASFEWSREKINALNSNKYWATRSYYGADEKLRVFNRFAGIGPNSDGGDRAHLGVYEEYWYDALGRRVQVWSRRNLGCNSFWPECPSAVNRFVWDGDQVLLESRVTGADTMTDWLDWGSPTQVAYAHMGGIDAPVAVFKSGGGASPVTVVPHANWRGEFEDGHAIGTTTPVINWPAKYEAVDGMPSNPPAYVWFGDMLTGFTDGSGQKYRRNRYYDPAKGTFTQTDPIGLAGGLNLYGYADGDPVNYSDPFGLCPIEKTGIPCFATMGVAGAGGGLVAGALWGAAGGTLVVPGVGTLAGGGGGALAGGAAGLIAGTYVGAARDLASISESINWGRIGRTIGLLGGLLAGGEAQDLSRRLLDIEKARATAAKAAADAERERKRKEEERRRGGAGGSSGDGSGDGGSGGPGQEDDVDAR